MSQQRDLIATASALLAKCDSARSFAEVQKTFDGPFLAVVHTLLHLPMVGQLKETAAPSSATHPMVSRFRQEFVDSEDDVYFMILVAAQKLAKEEAKANGGASAATRKRARTGGNANASLVDFTTNLYVLLYGREQPDVKHPTLRWTWLVEEKEKFMNSPQYVNSNARERKTLHQHSVLSIFSLIAHRHMFTALWTTLFGLKLHPVLHTHLLTGVGQCIIPHLSNPLAMADYLTDCFRRGGLTAVLALEGLFLLIVDHGFEYPAFYDQLYSLLDANCFSTRHRNQLFRLVDTCLTSLMVPAYIAASFIKRTARVALFSPAPVLYFALPFIRHLLQRHPNCLALIHRSPKDLDDLKRAKEGGVEDIDQSKIDRVTKLFQGVDPFNAQINDLAKTNAIDSTLWEFCLLENHFLPVVNLMVSAFSSPAEDKTPLKFDKTYARLFAHELTRKVTGKCTVAYEAPPTAPCTGPEDKCLTGIFKFE